MTIDSCIVIINPMKKTLLVLGFFVLNISFLSISFFFLASSNNTSRIMQGVRYATPVYAKAAPSYSALPQVLGTFTEGEIIESDARPGIVDKFLSRYHSPFQGVGQHIVEMADKYQIPYGIVPAIAQCESNVGKVIPYDSYNAWGYGVYGGGVLRFANWEDAIERVSRGLQADYYGKGLTTPESIMKKYTPGSNGSWARCVNQFLNELK